MQLEGAGQQPGDGGLAGARRSPQNDGMGRAGRHHAAQRAFGAQQMILPHHLGQGLGRSRSASGRGASSARPLDSNRSVMADK